MCPRHQRHLALTFCTPRSLILAFKESRALGYMVSSELLFLLAVGDEALFSPGPVCGVVDTLV